MEHAFFECPANYDLPDQLLTLLRRHQPGLNSKQVLTLNLELDPTMELAVYGMDQCHCSILSLETKEGGQGDTGSYQIRTREQMLSS